MRVVRGELARPIWLGPELEGLGRSVCRPHTRAHARTHTHGHMSMILPHQRTVHRCASVSARLDALQHGSDCRSDKDTGVADAQGLEDGVAVCRSATAESTGAVALAEALKVGSTLINLILA